MCGIVGYISSKKQIENKKRVQDVLLGALRRMEYRGYDSAGLAVFGGEEIRCLKKSGKVNVLARELNFDLGGHVGIGHTRWATHGVASDGNSHPHMDCKWEIYLAHNGIIENHKPLRALLESRRHKFASETDTEVVAHLIEDFLDNDEKMTVEEAFKKAIKMLEGSYGIVMIHRCEPEKIFVAKKESPIILGIGKGENIIASDPLAIIDYTRNAIFLEDGDIAIVKSDSYIIFNAEGERTDREIKKITVDKKTAEKGQYKHFMLKEIYDQASSIRNAIRGRFNKANGITIFDDFEHVAERLKGVDNILIVGCGTAYNAGHCGEYLFEDLTGMKVKTVFASEFCDRQIPLDKKTLVIVMSQSGETADTLAAVKKAKLNGCLTVGIINVIGSTIAREVDAVIYNHAGPEISVASTKAFTSQVSVLILLAVYLARQNKKVLRRQKSKMTAKEAGEIFRELEDLPRKIECVLQKEVEIKALAAKYKRAKSFIFLGRGGGYPTAAEAALKLKEISYIPAEGLPAGEMKHGPIALVDKKLPVVFFIPKDSVYRKNISNLEEVRARSGKIIAFATEGDEEITFLADDCVFMPKTEKLPICSYILGTALAQFLAYHMAVIWRRDVDQPRNLAKSVTVQ